MELSNTATELNVFLTPFPLLIPYLLTQIIWGPTVFYFSSKKAHAWNIKPSFTQNKTF